MWGRTRPDRKSRALGYTTSRGEMESLEDLQELYAHMKAKDVNIGGIGDHGISLGVYLFDPDGNEIEVYYEMSEEKLARRQRPVLRRVPRQA